MSYDYSELVPYLLHWYDRNARILAWRENPKPYYVWVSEIMLQQTRVEAVKGYFDRFIAALPTIKDLAEAEDSKMLFGESNPEVIGKGDPIGVVRKTGNQDSDAQMRAVMGLPPVQEKK